MSRTTDAVIDEVNGGRGEMKAVSDLAEATGRANRAFYDAIEKAYPVGSEVCYWRWKHVASGTVLGHSLDDLRVKRVATGKVYMINWHWLLDEYKDRRVEVGTDGLTRTGTDEQGRGDTDRVGDGDGPK